VATGLNRNLIIVALAALLALLLVAFLLGRRGGSQPLEIIFGEATPTVPGPMEVYITGAVAQPGVYEMAEGDRLVDALYEAGGPAPDANLEAINLALRLRDEHHIVVPRLGEPASGLVSGPTSDVAGAAAEIVNINTATAAQLDDLPGIGEVYSQRIVENRAWDGPFKTTDDLVERRLIPRSTYEKIKDLITVGP
jgi:competence protein ComEA